MRGTKECHIKEGKVVGKERSKKDLGQRSGEYVDVEIEGCNELDIGVYEGYE